MPALITPFNQKLVSFLFILAAMSVGILQS
jgi:hypothetical protein